jgi:uncharacterized protein (DUF697 family)
LSGIIYETSVRRISPGTHPANKRGIVTGPADPRILEGRRIAKGYAGWAASAGLAPVPLFDIAGLMWTQLEMLHSLTRLYGVPFERKRARAMLTAAAGSIGPQGVFTLSGLSAAKAVPILGGVLGFVVMPALAIASTLAVAEWFIQHLAAGGTLEDAEPSRPPRLRPPEIELAEAGPGAMPRFG